MTVEIRKVWHGGFISNNKGRWVGLVWSDIIGKVSLQEVENGAMVSVGRLQTEK